MSEQTREALQHYFDTLAGKPKKALVLDGPIKPRHLMTDGLKYLKRLGPESFRQYVLNHGVWFEGRANENDYACAVEWRAAQNPQEGQCFKNSREFCLKHPQAEYFEGYYLILDSPEHHAWVRMPDGRVVDFTLESVIQALTDAKKVIHAWPPLYLGIAVPHKHLQELDLRVAPTDPILEDYIRKSQDPP